MLTPPQKSQIARTVGRIRDTLEEVAANPDEYDLFKIAVEIYNDVCLSQRTCSFCGTALGVEAAMFSTDKLFISHSCRGIYSKEG